MAEDHGAYPGSTRVTVTQDRPSYLALHRSGELRQRGEEAFAALAACCLCPRNCGVDRLAGEQGFCRSTADIMVASWNVHLWEEPPISGTSGSGTIFFSGCTGRCLFCQNYPISQLGVGQRASVERLAGMMLELQQRGVHNINLVTGTHFIPQTILALDVAAGQGLHVPLVYNCSGYESVETLRLLDGIVDIYLPDAKYTDDAIAQRLSSFPDYVAANRAALTEMFRQVGDRLVLDDDGIAVRGMIVRHMVLPDGLAGSADVFRWIAASLSPDIFMSVMNQYFPAYQALDHPVLARKVTEEEYEDAIEEFFDAGLHNGWNQDCE
jgi:putative pyruvate formate lyase activating enzyme